MAVGDIYEVVLVTIVNGQRAINVQHWRETTACTDDIPAKSVCAMWEDVMMPLYLDCLSNEAALSCIYARRIRPTPHIPFQIVQSLTPGVIDSHAAPSNAAAIITQYTASMTRSGRGRQFITGIPESRITDGLMDSTEITDLETYADGLQGVQAAPAPFDGEWTCGVFSPLLNSFAQQEAYSVNRSMGTLESRRQPYGMVS